MAFYYSISIRGLIIYVLTKASRSSSPDDVDPGSAGQRRGRVRDEAGLLRGVASRGPHLLGAQRQDAAAQLQDLHQEPDRVS